MRKRKPIDTHGRCGELLKLIRDEAGMTQEDVAARLNVRQAFISKYESGDRRLDIDELSAVCEAIGTDMLNFATLYMTALKRRRKPPQRSQTRNRIATEDSVVVKPRAVRPFRIGLGVKPKKKKRVKNRAGIED